MHSSKKQTEELQYLSKVVAHDVEALLLALHVWI